MSDWGRPRRRRHRPQVQPPGLQAEWSVRTLESPPGNTSRSVLAAKRDMPQLQCRSSMRCTTYNGRRSGLAYADANFDLALSSNMRAPCWANNLSSGGDTPDLHVSAARGHCFLFVLNCASASATNTARSCAASVALAFSLSASLWWIDDEIRSGHLAAPVVLRHLRMARYALEVLHQQRRDAVHEIFRNVV